MFGARFGQLGYKAGMDFLRKGLNSDAGQITAGVATFDWATEKLTGMSPVSEVVKAVKPAFVLTEDKRKQLADLNFETDFGNW